MNAETETLTAEDVSHAEVRALLELRDEFVPPALQQHHATYHDLTNLGARMGMGDVPDEVAENREFDELDDEVRNAKTALVSTVAQNHAEAVAEALTAYRNGR